MEISIPLVTLILAILLLIFLGSGVWVGVGLGLVGLVGLAVFSDVSLRLISAVVFNILNNYALAAMPLFIFMGQVVYHSGVVKSIYSGVAKWVRIIPGGLVHCNIISCAIFAACSGSSVACAATMGSLAYPDQVTRRGYDNRLVLGSLAAGGTLGILIPPSITMIIYGAFVGESIGQLFMAGVIPGIIMSTMFMIYIFIVSWRNPNLVPMKRQKVNLRYFVEAISALRDIWPGLVLIVFILGSIYSGVATPTEAGAIAATMAIVMAAGLKLLTWDVLKKASLQTIEMSSFIGLLIIGANILGSAVGQLKIAVALSETVASLGLTPIMIWCVVVLVYIVAGCFLDALSIILISLPIVYPLLIGLGFDGIWFGVMLVIMNECGLITPPFGMNLFVLQGVSKEDDITNIARGAFPFFLIMVLSIVIFTALPELVLWLPDMMFTSGW